MFLRETLIMPRFAGIIVPEYVYHVTHRDNRVEEVFFGDENREVYRAWLKQYADKYGMGIWA